MTKKTPSHPGAIIRRQIVEALGLSVSDAAQALGVSRQSLSLLMNERTNLSPQMALRIEKVFGPKMDHLLRMQLAFDITRARNEAFSLQLGPYVPEAVQA